MTRDDLRDDDVITIKDESIKGEETRYVLYAAQFRDADYLGNRMSVTQNQLNGLVLYHANFHGPVRPEEMKIILEGMLELTVLGDQLQYNWEMKNGGKKKR